MIPYVALPVAPHTMLALLQFIERTQSPLTPGEIADEAIRDWLDKRRDEAERATRPILRGYQWKCLFLPEGTLLRVWCRSEHGYAEVVGDKLMYKGRSVSPNRFVAACSDTVRNAWVEVSVLMPGETAWKLASVRRREIEAAATREPTAQAQHLTQHLSQHLTQPLAQPAPVPREPENHEESAGATPGSPARAAASAGEPSSAGPEEIAHRPPHDYGETRRLGAERRDPRALLDRREFY